MTVADQMRKLLGDLKAESKKGTVYMTCPECEANFPLKSKDEPLPAHRAFKGTGQCPGAGKPGE